MPDDRRLAHDIAVDEMTCQEFVELVTDYLENALGAQMHERFERHLIDCPDCPFYLRQMQAVIGAVGMLRPTDLSPDARSVLMSRFRSWKTGE